MNPNNFRLLLIVTWGFAAVAECKLCVLIEIVARLIIVVLYLWKRVVLIFFKLQQEVYKKRIKSYNKHSF